MGAHSKLLNDGSNQSPKLRVFLKRAKLFVIAEDHRPDLASLDSLELEARFTAPAHATQLDLFNMLATPLDVGA